MLNNDKYSILVYLDIQYDRIEIIFLSEIRVARRLQSVMRTLPTYIIDS